MKLGKLIIENPYGKDYERDLPKKVRFIRIPIKSRYGVLKNVRVEAEIKNNIGEKFDSPGILHWQRQPRTGTSHLISVHSELTTAEDVKDHMYDFHFSQSHPINIAHKDTDKVDLLMRIEDLDYAITTIARENHIPAGEYIVDIKVYSDSFSKPKRKTYKFRFNEHIDSLENIA